MMTTLKFLLIIAELYQVITLPLYQRSSVSKISNLPVLIHHETHHLPTNHILQPLRKKKGPNLPILPIPHHLLIPTKLHVLPAQSNVVHSSVHTNVNHFITQDNINIPIVTRTVSHSTTNITHPTNLIPVLIPVHQNLIHDLSVIPLQRNVHNIDKIGHFRVAMNKKEDEMEEPNRYRSYYGGYGTGLFFGGHGAGHGFYAYG